MLHISARENTGNDPFLFTGTDADPFTAGPQYFSEENPENDRIRQKSLYNDQDKARVDNNQFFETRNNPLSSKGN